MALWSHRAPDEAFVLLFQRAALTIIEQPEALKSSTAALRDTLWRLLALPATRHEQAASTVSALTHLLLGREHIAPHLSEFCHHLEEHEAGKIVVDLVSTSHCTNLGLPLCVPHIFPSSAPPAL